MWPLSSGVGVKALVAWPLKNITFFAASLSTFKLTHDNGHTIPQTSKIFTNTYNMKVFYFTSVIFVYFYYILCHFIRSYRRGDLVKIATLIHITDLQDVDLDALSRTAALAINMGSPFLGDGLRAAEYLTASGSSRNQG